MVLRFTLLLGRATRLGKVTCDSCQVFGLARAAAVAAGVYAQTTSHGAIVALPTRSDQMRRANVRRLLLATKSHVGTKSMANAAVHWRLTNMAAKMRLRSN